MVRAFLDNRGLELYVVVEPGREGLPMEAAVNLALAREGLSAGAVTVRIAVLGIPAEQRRVRYREATLTRPRVGIAAVRAVATSRRPRAKIASSAMWMATRTASAGSKVWGARTGRAQ